MKRGELMRQDVGRRDVMHTGCREEGGGGGRHLQEKGGGAFLIKEDCWKLASNAVVSQPV